MYEQEAMSSFLALASSVVSFQAILVCFVRTREMDDCGALVLNSESLVSESGWSEIEGISAMAMPHEGWTTFVWLLNAGGSKTSMNMTSRQIASTGNIARYRQNAWRAGEEYGNIEEDKVQTRIRCSSDLEEWLEENQAEQQHMTSSDSWRVSCIEVERKSIELTKIVYEMLEGTEARTSNGRKFERSQGGRCGQDGEGTAKRCSQTESESQRDGRTVFDRLMGSRAQLPSGSEVVVNECASFPAPDLLFFVCR